MPNKPEILNVELVANSRFFWVQEVQLKFSNGAERTFERLRPSGRSTVMIVPMLDPETILLIREYAVGIEDYCLGLPKGLVDKEEPAEAAANRELKEEAGFGSNNLVKLKTLSTVPQFMNHDMHVYLARDLYPERLPGDEPEPIETVPWPVAKIDELITRDDFTESRSIAALLLTQKWLAQNS